MEEDLISLSQLNDFIFCPVSIYFHGLYGATDKLLYQQSPQLSGTNAHKRVDEGTYSTSKNIITALPVYSEKYGLYGKIDIYDIKTKVLRERKKKIKQIYDGYIFQLYGQYYCMKEMGYEIKKLEIHSIDDNKMYIIALPEDNIDKKNAFDLLIEKIKSFRIEEFSQMNPAKCNNCIYEPICDRSIS